MSAGLAAALVSTFLLVELLGCGSRKETSATPGAASPPPAMGSTPTPPREAPPQSSTGSTGKPCIRAGCSAELCIEEGGEPAFSTCMYRPEFDCYKAARCERDTRGQCGWVKTTELEECLQRAR